MPSDQEIADDIIARNWRQCDLLSIDCFNKLAASSIDKFPSISSAALRVIVLTQDCDLIRLPSVEPYIELLAVKEIGVEPKPPMRGNSSRQLHVQLSGAGSMWLDCSIHDKFRVFKTVFFGMSPSHSKLMAEDRELLRRWLGRRYTRAPFPDLFEERLAVKNSRIKSMLKSEGAKYVSCIFIRIHNENANKAEHFILSVRLAFPNSFYGTQSFEKIEEFEARFVEVLLSCPGIKFRLLDSDDPDSVDVRLLPESDITLDVMRQYKRFDADYRSIDDDAAVAPPDMDSLPG